MGESISQGKPPVMESIDQYKGHNPPSFVVSLRGEYGGRFPQQTSSPEMGFQLLFQSFQ